MAVGVLFGQEPLSRAGNRLPKQCRIAFFRYSRLAQRRRAGYGQLLGIRWSIVGKELEGPGEERACVVRHGDRRP